MRIFDYIVTTALAFVATSACTRQEPEGFLEVRSAVTGNFEIYRISSESPIQFVSEHIGHFNEKAALQPGSYLILADCSSEIVVVKPNATATLMAHHVEFEAPVPASDVDQFTIQCNRFDKVRFTQTLANRRSIDILSGRHEVLIGMLPYQLDFDASTFAEPQIRKIQLGSVAVIGRGQEREGKYFISPKASRISVTATQNLDRRVFVLPGQYLLELNGTKSEITVNGLEDKIIKIATLRVEAPVNAELDRAFQIRGNPLYIELEDGHWMNFDETYAVLPGLIHFKIHGSESTNEFTLAEEQDLTIKSRSVRVEIDCSPWEWSCLGSRKVYLYRPDQPYPFATGVTDVPILFLDEEVWVTIEGSRDIRVMVPKQQESTVFRAGKIQLVPEVSNKAGFVTDLVRIEATGQQMSGTTLDLNLDSNNLLPLIEGRYLLVNYTSSTTTDGMRSKSEKWLEITAGKLSKDTFPVLLSEKKYQQYMQKKQQSETGKIDLIRPKTSSESFSGKKISVF